MSDFDGHTPAPWGPAMREEWPPREVRVCAPGWIALATHHEPAAIANARLIAAAPDLLAERDRLAEVNAELVEALTGVIDMTVVMVDDEGNAFGVIRPVGDFSAARAALAKARGQA